MLTQTALRFLSLYKNVRAASDDWMGLAVQISHPARPNNNCQPSSGSPLLESEGGWPNILAPI